MPDGTSWPGLIFNLLLRVPHHALFKLDLQTHRFLFLADFGNDDVFTDRHRHAVQY